mmetsp:Transcript_40991/g.103262  ORF Transcript_40991/g.103262 Transcript_40991/m.103262 type:complete len:248 (-) Transcript_40991:42-785(-)
MTTQLACSTTLTFTQLWAPVEARPSPTLTAKTSAPLDSRCCTLDFLSITVQPALCPCMSQMACMGLMLVEPECGIPMVDKEWYVMQSEFYVDQSTVRDEDGADFDYAAGLKEQPDVVVFNGKEGALTHGSVLQAHTGQHCRIYFGNAGPNLLSTFHVIGAIFEKVYRDGSVVDEPSKFTQNVLVGPGSAAIVEFTPQVPGNYTLMDHALFRVEKGCVGFLSVKGESQPDIYDADHTPNLCTNCKLHP